MGRGEHELTEFADALPLFEEWFNAVRSDDEGGVAYEVVDGGLYTSCCITPCCDGEALALPVLPVEAFNGVEWDSVVLLAVFGEVADKCCFLVCHIEGGEVERCGGVELLGCVFLWWGFCGYVCLVLLYVVGCLFEVLL